MVPFDFPPKGIFARAGASNRTIHHQPHGFTPERDYSYIETNKHLRQLYPEIVEGTIKRIKELGGNVWREVGSDFLFINGELKVSIVICRFLQTQAGSSRWKIKLDSSLMPDITVAVRMDSDNKEILDYYILPALDIEDPKIRLAENNGIALDSYRFDDLEDFFSLTRREKVPEAA